jgi:hypothetical protein
MAYNKEFEHRNCKFNMMVELKTKVERFAGGKTYHTIRTYNQGGSYDSKVQVEDSELDYRMEEEVMKAKEHADSKAGVAMSSAEAHLLKRGFQGFYSKW